MTHGPSAVSSNVRVRPVGDAVLITALVFVADRDTLNQLDVWLGERVDPAPHRQQRRKSLRTCSECPLGRLEVRICDAERQTRPGLHRGRAVVEVVTPGLAALASTALGK